MVLVLRILQDALAQGFDHCHWPDGELPTAHTASVPSTHWLLIKALLNSIMAAPRARPQVFGFQLSHQLWTLGKSLPPSEPWSPRL